MANKTKFVPMVMLVFTLLYWLAGFYWMTGMSFGDKRGAASILAMIFFGSILVLPSITDRLVALYMPKDGRDDALASAGNPEDRNDFDPKAGTKINDNAGIGKKLLIPFLLFLVLLGVYFLI